MVKTKFKQTEIGLIPEDWEVEVLGKYAELINGRAYSLYEWEKRGIPVIRLQNLTGGDNYYFSTLKLPAKNYCNSGDLLYMWSATFGPFIWKGVKAIFHYHIWKIETNNEFLDKTYLYYKLEEITEGLKKTASNGGTMLHITKSFMDALQIPLPPLPEQQAIAQTLSDTDTWIESLEKLIDKKKLIKQGAMQNLLTQKEDWDEVMLGDLTKVFTKQTGFDYSAYIKPSLVKFKNKDVIPFIQNKDFHNKNINLNTDYFIPLNVALRFPNILLNEKSLLISISGSIGNVGIYELNDLAFIGGAVAILKFRDPRLIDWIMYYLKSTDGQNKLFGNVKSGSHQNLILDDIRKIEIPFPSISEQIRITTILSDMDGEIEALEKKLEKAQQLKQGMMQELLAGRIRLVESVKAKQVEPKPTKKHSDNFNDAVLIATMASVFGTHKFPLRRFKYTKVSYLLKRYKEEQDAGYSKYAAGPYKPKTRYGGAEKIAIDKKYVEVVEISYNGKISDGFIPSENTNEAIKYFESWYGADALTWIEKFKYEKNENLELWATIDMAIEDLKKKDEAISINTIKQVLKDNKEWINKLNRNIFSDINIQSAITKLETLFT